MTLGVSLGMTGRRVTFFTALTTSNVPCRLQPKVMPPSLMFGQEMFSSSACNAVGVGEDARQLDILVQRAAADVDDVGRPALAQLRQLFSDVPMDADPLQPDRVEHPGRRFDDALGRVPFARRRNRPFDTTPPSVDRSTTSLYSTPYPKQPLAAMSGLFSRSEPMAIERSVIHPTPHRRPRRPGLPGTSGRSAVHRRLAQRNDAAVAAAHAASHDALHRHL